MRWLRKDTVFARRNYPAIPDCESGLWMTRRRPARCDLADKEVAMKSLWTLAIVVGALAMSGEAAALGSTTISASSRRCRPTKRSSVLYVPPIETVNRRVPNQLGRYRLNLGAGVGTHGTPDSNSVRHAVTHGCMRVFDADLQWLYANVPLGTRVYVF
jgi:hypothetical protein